MIPSVVVVVVCEYGCCVITLIVASLPSSTAIWGLLRIFVSPTVEITSSTEIMLVNSVRGAYPARVWEQEDLLTGGCTGLSVDTM